MFNVFKRHTEKIDSKKIILYLIITFVLFVTTLLIVMALINKPIADDFAYFSHPLIKNPFKFTYDFYFTQTGRLAQAFFVSVLYRIFGSGAVTAGPIIELFSLFITLTWLYYLLLNKIKKQRLLYSFALGLTSAIVMLLASPSLFDSFLWLTSSSVYVTSLIGLIFNLCLFIICYRQEKNKFLQLGLFFISIVICQSFSEPTSAIIIFSLGALLFYKIIKRNYKKIKLYLLSFIASISGFLLVYLSPGSQHRQQISGSGFNFKNMFIKPIYDFQSIIDTLFSWRLIYILILAIIIALLMPKITKTIVAKRVPIAIVCGVVPVYLLFVITNYSMGNYIPLRAYTVPIAILGVSISYCMAIFFAVLAQKISNNKPDKIYLILTLLLIIFGISVGINSLIATIQAESLRNSLYTMRETSIMRQISNNKPTLNIYPAPIILNNSEAIDFYFDKEQIFWFEVSFKNYYNIPADKKIVFNSQPDGYCLNTQNPTWYGLKTCYNLSSQNQ